MLIFIRIELHTRCSPLRRQRRVEAGSMLFTIGDDFTWNDTTWLSHWSQPAAAAAVYLLACRIHNSRLRRKKREAANAAAENAESPSTPLLSPSYSEVLGL